MSMVSVAQVTNHNSGHAEHFLGHGVVRAMITMDLATQSTEQPCPSFKETVYIDNVRPCRIRTKV